MIMTAFVIVEEVSLLCKEDMERTPVAKHGNGKGTDSFSNTRHTSSISALILSRILQAWLQLQEDNP
jgi:hypothetical protein